jgi:hypothetical protein
MIGSSDAIGGYPDWTPLRPREMTATIYEALAIRPDTVVHDCLGRPLKLCAVNQSRSCTRRMARASIRDSHLRPLDHVRCAQSFRHECRLVRSDPTKCGEFEQ